jgi:hypothetical protein
MKPFATAAVAILAMVAIVHLVQFGAIVSRLERLS